MGRGRGVPVVTYGDLEAAVAHRGDERGDVVERRLGTKVRFGIGGAEDAEEPAHLRQRRSAHLGDRLERPRRGAGILGCGETGAVRLGDDHGEGVRDDVVHLPRDAGAFVARREGARCCGVGGVDLALARRLLRHAAPPDPERERADRRDDGHGPRKGLHGTHCRPHRRWSAPRD